MYLSPSYMPHARIRCTTSEHLVQLLVEAAGIMVSVYNIHIYTSRPALDSIITLRLLHPADRVLLRLLGRPGGTVAGLV